MSPCFTVSIFGLCRTICEAVSYSMSMVVRVALGLSAKGARVGAIVSDSFPGWCTLAAIRHLATAGTQCSIIYLEQAGEKSEMLQLEAAPLSHMQINMAEWDKIKSQAASGVLFADFHNLLWGVSDFEPAGHPRITEVCDVLNELQTPIHCIQAPAGIDINTGERKKTPLFASSTLSVGLPLRGMHRGRDFVGRHYICDISICSALYRSFGEDITEIFSEQPVVQIYPVAE